MPDSPASASGDLSNSLGSSTRWAAMTLGAAASQVGLGVVSAAGAFWGEGC